MQLTYYYNIIHYRLADLMSMQTPYDIIIMILFFRCMRILVLDYKIVADKAIMARRKEFKICEYNNYYCLSTFVSTIKLVTG